MIRGSEHPDRGFCVQKDDICFADGDLGQGAQSFRLQCDLPAVALGMFFGTPFHVIGLVIQEDPGIVFDKACVDDALQENGIGLIRFEQFIRRHGQYETPFPFDPGGAYAARMQFRRDIPPQGSSMRVRQTAAIPDHPVQIFRGNRSLREVLEDRMDPGADPRRGTFVKE